MKALLAALTRQVDTAWDRSALAWFVILVTAMFLGSVIFLVWLVLYTFFLR